MTKKISLLIVCMFIILSFSIIPSKNNESDALANSIWSNQGPQYEQGAYEDSSQPVAMNWSHQSHIYGSNTNAVQWKVPLTSHLAHAPVVSKEGVIYVPDSGMFKAFNPNGTLKWEVKLNAISSPVIASDGTIYAPGDVLTALNPDGSVKWTYSAVYNGFSNTPAIGSDGTIYIYNNNSQDYNLYAINPDGTMKWRSPAGIFKSSFGYPSGVLVSKDGKIFVPTSDGTVYAFSTKGEFLWKSVRYGDTLKGTFGLSPSGDLYIVGNTKLYIVNTDNGTLIKDIIISNNQYAKVTAPAFDNSDGTFYIGVDTALKAFNSDGSQKWIYQGEVGNINGTPIVDAEGTIYYGKQSIGFYAIKKDGTVKWAQKNLLNSSFAPMGGSYAFSSNGVIYTILLQNNPREFFLLALGDPREQPSSSPIDSCSGYLEDLERKIKVGEVTEEELEEARYRLIKTLYNLNQLEQGKSIVD